MDAERRGATEPAASTILIWDDGSAEAISARAAVC